MKNKEKMHRFNCDLPERLFYKFKIFAAKENVTMSQVVRKMVEKYLEEKNDK